MAQDPPSEASGADAPKGITSSSSPVERAAAIEKELRRIEEAALYSGQSQFQQAKIWRTVNIGLGAPASILAAVSAGTGLASAGARTLAAVLALIAAGLGAVMTTLNSNRRAEQLHISANAYLKLQNDARVARTIEDRKSTRLNSSDRG